MIVLPEGMRRLDGSAEQNFQTIQDYVAYMVEQIQHMQSAQEKRIRDLENKAVK